MRSREDSTRIGRGRRAPLAFVLVATGLLAPGLLDAQAITGVVRHQTTGEPISGVLVSVLDFEGNRIRGVLTDGSGGFRVEIPMGRYTLRGERIGLRAEERGPIELSTLNDLFIELPMAERAVEIAGLVVDSRVQSCRIDQDEAAEIQRWWQEIRTALEVSAALQEEEFGLFAVEKFEREWDRRLRNMRASNSSTIASSTTRAFAAHDVDFLMEGGFVQGERAGQRQYYGPDAEVLMSTAFLSQNCFSLAEERRRDDQIGLRFEPVEGRTVVDIEGTMWVDTLTSELQDIVFDYEDEEEVEDNESGGRVVFDYLENGAWIISDWFIRMPVLEGGQRRRGSDFRIAGYVEVGGSVTPMNVTQPVEGGPVGAIAGDVFDSIRGVGLPDASVSILGLEIGVLSDEAGRFTLTDVPVGRHALTFSHPDIDLWGLGTIFVEVEVEPGRTSAAHLGTPTFRDAVGSLCLGDGPEAVTVFVGHVLGPQREALTNVPIRFQYQPPQGGPRALVVRTDAEGRFVSCRLPGGLPVTVSVTQGDDWADVFEISLGTGLVGYREIWFTR